MDAELREFIVDKFRNTLEISRRDVPDEVLADILDRFHCDFKEAYHYIKFMTDPEYRRP